MKERSGMPYDVVAYEADDLAMQLNEAEEGLFHRMLRRSWMNGSIPEDLNALASICRTHPAKLKKAWIRIAPLWVPHPDLGGRLINLKQESERAYKDSVSKSAKHSADERWKHKKEKDEANANALRTQSDGNASHSHPLPHSHPQLEREIKQGKETTTSAEADKVRRQPNYQPDFEEFWQASTRRGSKQEALIEWRRIPAIDRESGAIGIGMRAWQQSAQWQDETKQPHVCRWLKRRGWEEIVPRVMGGNGNGQRSFESKEQSRERRAIEGLADVLADRTDKARLDFGGRGISGPNRLIPAAAFGNIRVADKASM